MQLAKRLGISRTPLREALRRLVAESLIIGDFNQQMRVSDLNLDDFDQIYAMRIALEPVGIAATIPTLTAAQQGSLRNHVHAMDDAIAALDLHRFRTEHRAFHLGLVSGAGARMRQVFEDLWDHSERYRLTYLHVYRETDHASLERLRLSQSEHTAILDAAVARDIGRCADHLVAHLQRTIDSVFDEQLAPRPDAAAAAFRTHLTRR